MKENIWKEELVDAYVDDECSSHERAIVEALLREDAEAKNAADWALRLRELMAHTREETPPDFSQRLTTAIAESDAWQNYGVSRARSTTRERANRGKWIPTAVGATAAALAFVAFGLAYHSLRVERPAPTGDPTIAHEVVKDAPNSGIAYEHEPARPSIQTPASAGSPLSIEERPASQEARWATVRIADATEHRRLNNLIQRFGAKFDVDFMKFDANRELLFQGITPQAWRELRQTLEASGELEISDALQAWSADGAESERCDVRVTITFANPETNE